MMGDSVRVWAVTAAWLGAASLAACDASDTSGADAAVRLASAAAPATEGAWAECQREQGDESGWSRSICPDPEPDGDPRDCATSHVSERQDDGSMWCEVTALCNYECVVDADCPQPQSGTVVPVCNHVCHLPCEATSECPDGMTCHHQDHGDAEDSQGFCRYVYVCE